MAIKQVIIIRKDLKMRRGKEISQGAHASMKVFLDLKHSKLIPHGQDHMREWRVKFLTSEMMEWLQGSFTKVCLKANSEKELLDIYSGAKKNDLPCSLVCDSGKTEFDGNPTNTAVAIGPAKSEDIDKITGHLKLY